MEEGINKWYMKFSFLWIIYVLSLNTSDRHKFSEIYCRICLNLLANFFSLSCSDYYCCRHLLGCESVNSSLTGNKEKPEAYEDPWVRQDDEGHHKREVRPFA